MNSKSILLRPPKPLSSCIAAAIFRDTRGASLKDADCFNYFPATPLVPVTLVLEGELHMATNLNDFESLRQVPPLPSLSVTSLRDQPTVSWSPGEVCAITIGFYPDAWVKLGSRLNDDCVPKTLGPALRSFSANHDPKLSWNTFCDTLLPMWEARRNTGGIPDWPGSDRLSDWSRYILSRVGMTTPGLSVRTLERRLRHWAGRTKQNLALYTAIENLHARKIKNYDTSLAGLANDAGFADQSHMGRAVLRTTGFSPAKLNQLIQTEESFWCYRLLGERF